MTWLPKPTQIVETSHWTSSILHSVPLQSFSRLWDLGFQMRCSMVQTPLFGWEQILPLICVNQSVLVWGAMSSAGVGPLCFIKTRVNAAVYQDILEHFMLSSADNLYGDADFIFQQDLAPAHTAKTTKTWFNDHGITVLDWPANSPDLNPIENLWGIAKRKMRDMRPTNAKELKAAIEASWSSITPQQCHRLIASMPRHIDAGIHAKGASTKYWVHKWTYFSKVWHFCIINTFFDWSYEIF